MKIYEVFVCVPYLDPDYNERHTRHNGVFFANKDDAKKYLDKMFADKKANYKLEPQADNSEKRVRRYITLDDYTETEITWEDFCRQRLSKKIENKLYKIFMTNFLVDEMRYREAILLAVTYGGNKWFLREVELN